MPARLRTASHDQVTNDAIVRFLTIRRKASFLSEIIHADVDLTHRWDRQEFQEILDAIFSAADGFLEQHHQQKGAR